jgi:CubicO group peptidase (beta-lactamase class C family)
MGFGMITGPSDATPIQRAMKELELSGIGPPKPASPLVPDEWMRRFGTLPLMHQPGAKWMYNTSAYVLGVLIARAAGQPLESFFRERIFAPLGMKDTSFSVPADKLDRLATSYWPDAAAGTLAVHDDVANSQWRRPPAFPDGGAGLVSTVDDYLAFGQMMLDGGTLRKERILSRPSVEAMTTDHLTPAQKAISGFLPGFFDALGWGFGVSIVTRRDGVSAIPGRYGWDGGYGTTWSSDPAEQMVSIMMTQRAGFPLFSSVHLDFWTSAYQAIDD